MTKKRKRKWINLPNKKASREDATLAMLGKFKQKLEDDQYDIERSQPKQNQLMKILFIRPMRLLRRKMNLMTP